MKERNVTITLSKAREWFNSGNATLREVTLQAFSKDELVCNFRDITTFKKACEVLGLNYDLTISAAENIAYYSKSSAAMLKLNIIRKAINFGQDLHLAKNPKDSCLYYPYNPLVTSSPTHYMSGYNLDRMEVIGRIGSEGKRYDVLSDEANPGVGIGLCYFSSRNGVGDAFANFGFLGCASKEIAEHFGKYFGMLITEAKYADIVKDFEIVESKYAI